LAKIANHVVKREVTDKYLILDTEFIRPHTETISVRLLELMETSVQEWKLADQQGLPDSAPEMPVLVAGLIEPLVPEAVQQIAWVLVDEAEDEDEVLDGSCW
jgi:hypothetical protein